MRADMWEELGGVHIFLIKSGSFAKTFELPGILSSFYADTFLNTGTKVMKWHLNDNEEEKMPNSENILHHLCFIINSLTYHNIHIV